MGNPSGGYGDDRQGYVDGVQYRDHAREAGGYSGQGGARSAAEQQCSQDGTHLSDQRYLTLTQIAAFYMTTGLDGNLWFTESGSSQIGRITPAGVVTEFPTPTPYVGHTDITARSDGNLWFTDIGTDQIGRITPSGHIAEFPTLYLQSWPQGITLGPDGNLWFTEELANQIGRITPSGQMTEFPIPTPQSAPTGIVVGPDGNLWFTEQNGNQMGA